MLIEIPNATSKNNLVATSIANVGVAFSRANLFVFSIICGTVNLMVVGNWVF